MTGPEIAPPARSRTSLRRVAPLVAVLAVTVGAALVDMSATGSPSSAPRPVAVDAVAPAGAESSAWYCTGGAGTGTDLATPALYLTNVTANPVRGTVSAVSDTGSTGSQPVVVAGRTQLAVSPALLVHGSWVASRIDLDGGGVVATQSVDGPHGWSMTPCASTTSHAWYFASGSTTGGHDLFVSLFNPTASDAVVDLSFRTPSGVASYPPPFQGILVPANGLAVADVGSYVQGASDLSTEAVTRAGLVVADELEVATGTRQGLSLRLGAPSPVTTWALPRTVDVTGGSSVLHIFNPTSSSESVTASFRLPSGPTAPMVNDVAPGATLILDLSTTSRLPHNDDFSTRIAASGSGVVVDRVLEAPSTATLPQWGALPAVDSSQWPARSWVLSAPGIVNYPATSGAAPFALALLDQGSRPVTARIGVLTGTTVAPLTGAITLSAGVSTVVEPGTLAPAGLRPIIVTADGPLAVMEDFVPAGAPGVVSLPGIAVP